MDVFFCSRVLNWRYHGLPPVTHTCGLTVLSSRRRFAIGSPQCRSSLRGDKFICCLQGYTSIWIPCTSHEVFLRVLVLRAGGTVDSLPRLGAIIQFVVILRDLRANGSPIVSPYVVVARRRCFLRYRLYNTGHFCCQGCLVYKYR